MPFLPKVNGKLLGFAPGFLLYAVILPVALPPFETLERGTYYAYFNGIDSYGLCFQYLYCYAIYLFEHCIIMCIVFLLYYLL